jgi:glycosyltransferase involved in cell wall biosynthesis
MNTQPLVSILINNYNYGHFLKVAIDSALNQTYSNIEVIVVDDGSTDNSQEIIAHYQDKIIPVLKSNGGQTSAFNAGFANSRGDIICFLDADDIFTPEKAMEVSRTFQSDPELGWCFHPLKLVNEHEQIITQKEYQNSSKYDCRIQIRKGKLGNPFPFKIPATSGMCFTRELLQQLLPMPETDGITLNDSYLKFCALALSPGFALSKELACQRIHSNNAFTFKKDKKLIARINIVMAYWMRTVFPITKNFSDNAFALGIKLYNDVGSIEPDLQAIIKKYLASSSLFQRFKIQLKTLYYSMRP